MKLNQVPFFLAHLLAVILLANVASYISGGSAIDNIVMSTVVYGAVALVRALREIGPDTVIRATA